MAISTHKPWLLVLSLIIEVIGDESSTVSNRRQAEVLCQELATDPFFEPDMVTGKPWRIYYSWNMKLENLCMDMQFKIATPEIIRRIYYDMSDYLEEQPAWGAASLLITMGRAQRELLLFDAQGPAGKFLGVPNVVRDGNMLPGKNTVPLLNFQLKVINHGKFLVIMDCMIGVASMAGRFDEPPYRAEVDAAATSLIGLLGEGTHACAEEHNKNELLPSA